MQAELNFAKSDWKILEIIQKTIAKPITLIDERTGENQINDSCIKVDIYLERQPNYYIRNIIIPTHIISIVSFFCVFIPIESNEKIGLSATALLSFIFLQSTIKDMIPQQPLGSYLEKFVVASIIISAFNVCSSALIKFFYEKHPSKVPFLLIWFILRILAVFLTPEVFIKKYLRCCFLAKEKPPHLTARKNRLDNDNPEIASNKDSQCTSTYEYKNRPTVKLSNLQTENEDNWHNVGIILNRLVGLVFISSNLIAALVYLFPLYFGHFKSNRID